MIERKISDDEAGQRLDKYVRALMRDVPKSHVYKMIRTKKIRVNGKRTTVEYLLQAGDVVTIRGDEEKLLSQRPEGERPRRPSRALKVLYEDDHVLAIDKPAGMAVHPGSGIVDGTVVDEIRAYLGPRAVRNNFTASPAHRLDRDTSGAMFCAKSRRAMVGFTDIFTRNLAHKVYLVLVKGHFDRPVGVIDTPLPEHQQSAKSKAERGINLQEAVTRYKVLARGQLVSLVECTIETGRTHQIRRHMASIGHPVAGDRKHGDFAFNRELRSRYGLKRMFLHARSIGLRHPVEETRLKVEAPLPPELVTALRKMGIKNPDAA